MLPSPTASPAWLANGELGLKCAEGPDQFLDLALPATHAARWLDRNRISGSPENLATARRALAQAGHDGLDQRPPAPLEAIGEQDHEGAEGGVR